MSSVRIYLPLTSPADVPIVKVYPPFNEFALLLNLAADGYEMIKALYDFKATFAKTLSFREGEYFILLQRNIKQKNWWQVVNKDGRLGYIPSNYVTPVKVRRARVRSGTRLRALLIPVVAN